MAANNNIGHSDGYECNNIGHAAAANLVALGLAAGLDAALHVLHLPALARIPHGTLVLLQLRRGLLCKATGVGRGL